MDNDKPTIAVSKNLFRIALIDASIILLMVFLPTFSHMLSFPLYKFEPMRIMVLAGYLLSANKKNAYGLAIILPLFSFITTGHPLLIKSVLMISELTINVFLFSFLVEKKLNVFFAMLVSIVLSKVFYYGIKFVLISTGIMNTNLIDTQIGIQVLISCVIALAFALVYKPLKSK